MRPEALGFLGLMRRAGKLSAGEEGVRQSVRAGKAKLILLASDASPNAQKRAEDFSDRCRRSCRQETTRNKTLAKTYVKPGLQRVLTGKQKNSE